MSVDDSEKSPVENFLYKTVYYAPCKDLSRIDSLAGAGYVDRKMKFKKLKIIRKAQNQKKGGVLICGEKFPQEPVFL